MKRTVPALCFVIFALLFHKCERPRPTMLFTISSTNVEVGEEVVFTNKTTGATSYKWFFGDGGESREESPVHIYESPGNYFITLAAFNGNEKGVAYASITVVPAGGLTNSTLKVTVRQQWVNSVITQCFVQLYASRADYDNDVNPIQDGFTDDIGEISFSNLAAGTYYLRADKSSGTEYWTNDDLDFEVTVGEGEETSYTLYTSYRNTTVPFKMLFTNEVFTPLTITMNSYSQTAYPGETVVFDYTYHPGTVSYYAETQGDFDGTAVGEYIYWDFSNIDVTGLYDKHTRLIINSNLFFLNIKNNSGFNLYPIDVYSVINSYYFTEYIEIPNDGVVYPLGYYNAYDDIAIEAYYSGFPSNGILWDNGYEFTLPMEDNQSVVLDSDNASIFMDGLGKTNTQAKRSRIKRAKQEKPLSYEEDNQRYDCAKIMTGPK